MFGLVQGLWQYVFAKQDAYVLVVGIQGSGKTTFIEQLKALHRGERDFVPPQNIPSTVGLNTCKIETGPYRLTFWDLGGQSSLRSIWEKYIPDAHAMVFIVDSSSAENDLVEARQTLHTLLRDHPGMRKVL